MTPTVSILIPAYNAQRWIHNTIESALAQTWRRREIIVVDDGSTDRTAEVIRRYQSDGVRVVTQANQGAAAARNKLFSLCEGDYIQWLDADDLLSRDKISRQVEALRQCEDRRTLLSSSWGRFLYRYQRATFVPTPLWCDLSPTEWLLRKMGQNLHMQTATWLVSRELTEAAGPWDRTQLGDDDGEYFCRVLLASNGVRFVPDAKVYYRASGPNSLNYIGRSEAKMVAQWESMALHIQYLRSLEDSERVRAACVKYLQNWLLFFYPERPDIVEKAMDKAREAGGRLYTPKLSWKYSWIRALFGWNLAKIARLKVPEAKGGLIRYWDRTMFRLQSQPPID